MFEPFKVIRGLLTRPQRRAYRWLLVLFSATAVLQVAGIASLAPFIALLSNIELIHTNDALQSVYEWCGFSSDVHFIVCLALLIMVMICLSNVVSGFSVWAIARFSLGVGCEFQSAVYSHYLHQDYELISRQNSATLITTLTQEIPRFIFMVLQPFLNLASQALVVLLLACGLLYVSPLTALLALVLIGGSYGAVFAYMKVRLAKYGEQIWRANTGKQQLLNESLGGIKEVKLFGAERQYEAKVDEANRDGLNAGATIGLLGDLPKFALETIAFCALLLLAVYLLSTGHETQEIVGVLSLYAMSGYKFLPAAQAIFKAASQIKANLGAAGVFSADVHAGRAMRRDTKDSRADDGGTPIEPGDLELHDVSYRYPGANANALSHVNIRIPKHTAVALVGPSGAGKSTIADILLGILKPTSGQFRVAGVEITPDRVRAWQAVIGYVPQNIFLVDDTVASNIVFGLARRFDKKKLYAAAEQANALDFISALPGGFDYVVGERGTLLSGGQRQRLGIARALYDDADVLLLDEATSALDGITEQEIIATINDLKARKTIVMIAHRMTTIRCADQIIMIDDGQVTDYGSFSELRERNAEFRALYAAGAHEPETADQI